MVYSYSTPELISLDFLKSLRQSPLTGSPNGLTGNAVGSPRKSQVAPGGAPGLADGVGQGSPVVAMVVSMQSHCLESRDVERLDDWKILETSMCVTGHIDGNIL